MKVRTARNPINQRNARKETDPIRIYRCATILVPPERGCRFNKKSSRVPIKSIDTECGIVIFKPRIHRKREQYETSSIKGIQEKKATQFDRARRPYRGCWCWFLVLGGGSVCYQRRMRRLG